MEPIAWNTESKRSVSEKCDCGQSDRLLCTTTVYALSFHYFTLFISGKGKERFFFSISWTDTLSVCCNPCLSAFLGAASGGFCLCLVLSMMRLCSSVLAFRIRGNTKAGNLLSLLNLGIWWLGRLLSLLSPHEREDAVNASEPLSAQFH